MLRKAHRMLLSRRRAVAGAGSRGMTGSEMTVALCPERRLDPGANALGERTAGAETAAARRIDRARRIARERRLIASPFRIHRQPRGQERLGVGVARRIVD